MVVRSAQIFTFRASRILLGSTLLVRYGLNATLDSILDLRVKLTICQ